MSKCADCPETNQLTKRARCCMASRRLHDALRGSLMQTACPPATAAGVVFFHREGLEK